MPTYRHRCPKGHETLEWRSIHQETVREIPCPECGRVAPMILASPAIAAEALPNKKHGVIAKNQQERQWHRDMDAYKRLRTNGVQPRGIDGSGDLEQSCNSPIEFEIGKPLGKEKDVRRAEEITSELFDQDVTSEGKKIGAAKRTAA